LPRPRGSPGSSGSARTEVAAGVDFMKQFWPKFTNKT
jgi:hypothetical protein